MSNPSRRPVDPETRARIVARLLEPDPKRNAIAREFGVAASTVSAIAEDQGVTFDRTSTALATAARALDLKRERTDIAAMLLVRAREALEQMDSPMVYFELDRAGTWREYEADTPTVSDKRSLVTIAGIAVQRHADLVRMDATPETTAQESVVATLMAGLEGAAAAIRARQVQEGTDAQQGDTGVSEERAGGG